MSAVRKNLPSSEGQHLDHSPSRKVMLQSAIKFGGPGHVYVASGIAIPSIQPDGALARARYVALLDLVMEPSRDMSPCLATCSFESQLE